MTLVFEDVLIIWTLGLGRNMKSGLRRRYSASIGKIKIGIGSQIGCYVDMERACAQARRTNLYVC